MPECNTMELMVVAASRILENGASVGVGTGAPLAASMLAQKMQAPDLVIMFEAGGISPVMCKMPISVGDSRSFNKALMASGMCDIMESCQRGMVDYTFLGGAQIDMYGNLNSTVIGDYEHPKVRLPGSGGGNDVGSFCWRTIAIMRHEPQRFIPKLDFVTTPGYLTGPGAREAAGLFPGSGPYRVVTNLATLGYEDASKRMQLIAVNPGVTVEEVVAATSFPLLLPAKVEENAPPTDEELRALREEIDPEHLYI